MRSAHAVSIRSPHRSKGRLPGDSPGPSRSPYSRFNPLPSPKQGETMRPCRLALALDCFNPLPSPKQGETAPVCRASTIIARFNPLPSPKQGETSKVARPAERPVSIRSPHRSKGRRLRRCGCTIGAWFQSAPLTEARGDRSPIRRRVHGNVVSIRSPHRSKGRHAAAQRTFQGRSPAVFQSAPLTEARGDAPNTSSAPIAFQSAPLTEARGDGPQAAQVTGSIS